MEGGILYVFVCLFVCEGHQVGKKGQSLFLKTPDNFAGLIRIFHILILLLEISSANLQMCAIKNYRKVLNM